MSITVPGIALLLSSTLTPQNGDGEPTRVEAFRNLKPDTRAQVVVQLKRQTMLHANPLMQQIAWMHKKFESYPVGEPMPHHDSEKWADGAAPERHIIRPSSKKHEKVRREMAPPPFLPKMHRAIYYDWRTQQIVRTPLPLRDDQLFENYLNGFPFGADAAVAHLLAAVDRSEPMRKYAWFFSHAYADRDGGVYQGVTLYDAWYSGNTVEVPDVDAIAFAVEVLDDDSYRAPLPPDARRARLYDKIREATLEFRKYRTLREAAAAAFVRARPTIDPTYESLLPRLHYLFAELEGDPEEFAKWLGPIDERDVFLERVDRMIRDDDQEARDLRLEQLTELQMDVRGIALEALTAARG